VSAAVALQCDRACTRGTLADQVNRLRTRASRHISALSQSVVKQADMVPEISVGPDVPSLSGGVVSLGGFRDRQCDSRCDTRVT